MGGTKIHKTRPNKAQKLVPRAELTAKKPQRSLQSLFFFPIKKKTQKNPIDLCCSRLSHQADVNVSSAFKCRLPNVSAHSTLALAPGRTYCHKTGAILLATSWVMHERHVSGNRAWPTGGENAASNKETETIAKCRTVCFAPPSVVSPC